MECVSCTVLAQQTGEGKLSLGQVALWCAVSRTSFHGSAKHELIDDNAESPSDFSEHAWHSQAPGQRCDEEQHVPWMRAVPVAAFYTVWKIGRVSEA